jgi:DNA-binding MarR family transcriptional regulator
MVGGEGWFSPSPQSSPTGRGGGTVTPALVCVAKFRWNPWLHAVSGLLGGFGTSHSVSFDKNISLWQDSSINTKGLSDMDDFRIGLVERLIENMERMQVRMRSRPPAAWSGVELTMPQAKTLFLLGRGPRRMGDISTYLGRGMPSATSMIDRLLAKGLVERVEDASDRRVVACQLTAAGTEAVERFWRLGRLRLQSLADVLTLEELEIVVPAIEILSDAVGRDGYGALEETESKV